MTEHDSRGTAADGPDTAPVVADTPVDQPAPTVAAERPAESADGGTPDGPSRPARTPRSTTLGPQPQGPRPTSGRSGRVAGRSAKRTKPKRPFWIELPILIVIAFGLTFLIQTFVAKVYYVPSGSMETDPARRPTGGDRILANKIVYDFRDPQQGDVVVFAGPETWAPEARIAGPTSWFGSHAVRRFGGRDRAAEREGLRQAGHRGRRPDRHVLRRAGQRDGRRPVRWSSPTSTSRSSSSPAQLDCTTTPDVPALLRSGHRAGRPAVGDGRSPVRLGGLLATSCQGTAGRAAAPSVRVRSRWTTSSARPSSS